MPEFQPRINALSFSWMRSLLRAVNRCTRNALTKSMIEDFKIPFPSLDEQQSISDILGSIDDVIELNTKSNLALESIAQALFKSWIIDFDLVKAKMAGRQPEAMDEATTALFPAEFEESEIGLIPKGWQVKTVGCVTFALNPS